MADTTDGSSQVPDPTVLEESITRRLAAERDYTDGRYAVLDERLNGIDRATKLLSESVTRVPTDVQEAIAHLKELHGERFESIGQQFVSRDTALAAAFEAQEKYGFAQNQANREAIATNQQMTAEAIRNLGQLLATNYGSLSEKIDDLKGTRREGVGLSANVLATVAALALTAIGIAVAFAVAFQK